MSINVHTKQLLAIALADGAAANDLEAALDTATAGDVLGLAALGANGLVARTGASTSAARTVTGTANQITVTNGSGAAGDPTISLPVQPNVTTGYAVGGTKVVGAQGAAVADSTDAASVITQLNALLARLRTHGLIAP